MHRFSLPARHAVLGVCVLVWLLMVPLQSWAQTVMPFVAAANVATVDMPPCHDLDAPETQAGCHDCALCHWVAAPVPLWHPDAAAPAPRGWVLSPDTPPPLPAMAPPRKPPRA